MLLKGQRNHSDGKNTREMLRILGLFSGHFEVGYIIWFIQNCRFSREV